MKRVYFYIFLSFLIPVVCQAQTNSTLQRSNDNKFPEGHQINLKEVREDIYAKIPDELRNEKHPRSTYRFADQSAIQLSALFSSGRVYSDWQVFEDYLNEILLKVMPDELKNEKQIKVYLVKNGHYNAFMTPSGKIFIHIGLFDGIDNEATLAGILAHELAHYYLKHAVEGYVKAEKGEFKPGFLFKNKGAASKFSIQNELEADSLSLKWVIESNYNADGLLSSFDVANKIEEKTLLLYKRVWEFEEVSHPNSKNRTIKFNKIKETYGEVKGEDFLVSKDKFMQFSEIAKLETLKILLDNFEYSKCMETAFKYHLYNTTNPDYIYFLMESIRRTCYIDYKEWNKNFITNRYYEIIEDKKGKRKEKMTAHIFEKFPSKILLIDEEELPKLEGEFYWKKEIPKFKTNEQAFLFFGSVGKYLKAPECTLSNALSLSFNKEMCHPLLKEYLSYSDIQYRDYATNLLNGTIQDSLPNKKMTVLSSFWAQVKQGKDEILLMQDDEDESAFLKKIITESTSEFTNRKSILLSELKKENLSDYLMLNELESLSFSTILARGQQTKLHILDPRYWNVLKKYNVNEIEFLNFSYYDVRKPNITLQGYKDVINTDYNAFLQETKRNRYVDVLVTSIRAIENGSMSVKYYGGEDKLKYKKAGYAQVIELLKSKLKGKDRYAKEQDGR